MAADRSMRQRIGFLQAASNPKVIGRYSRLGQSLGRSHPWRIYFVALGTATLVSQFVLKNRET